MILRNVRFLLPMRIYYLVLLLLGLFTQTSHAQVTEQAALGDTTAWTTTLQAGYFTAYFSHQGFQFAVDRLQPYPTGTKHNPRWFYGAHARLHALRYAHSTAHLGMHSGWNWPLGYQSGWELSFSGQLGYSPRWQLTSQTVNLQGETVSAEYERRDYVYLGLDSRFIWQWRQHLSVFFQAANAYHYSGTHPQYSTWYFGTGFQFTLKP